MNLLPITKILRFSLAISVSLWMAGAGCLLGCSNETHASSSAQIDSVETVVAEHSCASSSHDCCAKKKAEQVSNTTNDLDSDLMSASQLSATYSSMLESCPMAVSASAIVSKGRAETPKASVAKTIEAPLPSTSHVPNLSGTEGRSLYNRGPTYLRCCVFLI